MKDKSNYVKACNVLIIWHERIAKALRLPAAYLYASDDQAAELLLQFHRLKKSDRTRLSQVMSEMF